MVSSAALSGAVFNIATPHLRATPIHRSVVPPFLRVLQFLSLSLALFLLLLSSIKVKIRSKHEEKKKKEVQITVDYSERRFFDEFRRMFVEPSWMNFFFVTRFRILCNRSRENTVCCDVSGCDEFQKKKDKNERRFREKFAYLGGWLSTGSPWTFYECKYRCSYRLPAFPSSFSLFLALFVLSAYSQLFLTWTAVRYRSTNLSFMILSPPLEWN